MIEDCGISENAVILEPDRKIIPCAYESGVTMKITFGGRSAVFTSGEVLRTTTKPSFMFGASLNNPVKRAAAAGIINSVAGFLCTCRKLYPCIPDEHAPCLTEISCIISGKKIFCIGEMPLIREHFSSHIVSSAEDADLVLITGDGLIGEDSHLIPETLSDRYLFIGPSSSGVAGVRHGDHFCPYGRPNL